MGKETSKQEKLLELKHLYVEYSSNLETVKAVNDVELSLERGATLGLVGETGAGKTSIARAILRILPDPPAKVPQGEIFFEGEDLQKISEAEMRKIRGAKISMIFQDPMTALNPVLTVGKQISEAIKLHKGISKEESIKEAKKMLEMVGIPGERYEEYPHQFSGGMKQRVVIAIALACSPHLLIADEPTTALDVTIQAQVLNLIKALQQSQKMAMILITHDFGIVAETCDYVAVIYAGQIVEYGTAEQLFGNKVHPYTRGLFGSIPKLTGDVERLHSIDGMPPDPTNLPQGCYFSPRCKYADECCKKDMTVPLCDVGDGHLCRCLKAEQMAKEGYTGEKSEG
ncbi:MAG: ABC transporter ATP-binding protein [Lachnospiraceae bacterium]|nr:ABC transporter ATP-binding protein [Lachnospiraceae bacterium]